MLWKRGCVLGLQLCGLGLGDCGLVNITGAATEVEPARRNAASLKVELQCSCSWESAQVECTDMHLIEWLCSCQLSFLLMQ